MQCVMEVDSRRDQHTRGVCVVRVVQTMLIRPAESRWPCHRLAAIRFGRVEQTGLLGVLEVPRFTGRTLLPRTIMLRCHRYDIRTQLGLDCELSGAPEFEPALKTTSRNDLQAFPSELY